MSSYFQITLNSPKQHRSLVTPSAAATRGQVFQESATQGTAELADGTKPIVGFVTRDVSTTRPTLDQLMVVDGIYPTTGTPGLIPFYNGETASFSDAEEIDVEGSDYIDTSVSTAPSIGDAMVPTSGKWKAAASTNLVEFVVTALPTARDSGNIRFVLGRVHAYVKA